MSKWGGYDIILGLVTGLIVIGIIWNIDELYLVAAGIGIISIVSTKAAMLISKLWMRLGYTLGLVNGTILLSLSYIAFLVPIGWLKKRFDPVFEFNEDRKGGDCLMEVNRDIHKEDFDKPW